MRRDTAPATASLTRRRMRSTQGRQKRCAGIARCAGNTGFSGLSHSLLQQV